MRPFMLKSSRIHQHLHTWPWPPGHGPGTSRTTSSVPQLVSVHPKIPRLVSPHSLSNSGTLKHNIALWSVRAIAVNAVTVLHKKPIQSKIQNSGQDAFIPLKYMELIFPNYSFDRKIMKKKLPKLDLICLDLNYITAKKEQRPNNALA